MTKPTITDADREAAEEIEKHIDDESERSAGHAAQFSFDSEQVAAIIARHREQREKRLVDALRKIEAWNPKGEPPHAYTRDDVREIARQALKENDHAE